MLSGGFLQGGLQANPELRQPRLQQLEQKGSCLNTVGSHDLPLTVSSTLSFPGSPLLWLNRLDHLTWLKGRLAEVVATNGTLLRSWDGPCGDAPVNGDRKNLAVDG